MTPEEKKAKNDKKRGTRGSIKSYRKQTEYDDKGHGKTSELISLIEKQRPKLQYYTKFYLKKWTDLEIEKIADDLFTWFTYVDPKDPKEYYYNRIWMKDFFIERGIAKELATDFCLRNEYFNFMYKLCNEVQEAKLVKLGLKNNSVISMVIFTLKNVAKWRDRIESIQGITDDELNALRSEAAKQMKSSL